MISQNNPIIPRPANLRPTAAIPAPPPPPMDDLLRRAAATAQKSRSPNTERAYQNALRSFAKFAAAQGRPAFPAEARVIAAFLQHWADLEFAPTTLKTAASAIRYAHLMAKKPDPTKDPNVRAVLQGYRRIWSAKGKRPKQAKGLSESDLAAIVATARADGDIRAVRDIAIVYALRDCLLRRGECAALRVRNFSRNADGSGRLFISRSKTDQEGQGCLLFLGEQAAAAVAAWLEAAPADSDAPLFREIRRGGRVQSTGITGNSVSYIIKSRGEAAGIYGLSGHSGRVGMAQDLVAFGASVGEVAIAGRWKTVDMVVHYAAHQEAGQGAVAKYRGQVK